MGRRPRDDDETRAFVAEWFAPGPPIPRRCLIRSPDWDPRGPPSRASASPSGSKSPAATTTSSPSFATSASRCTTFGHTSRARPPRTPGRAHSTLIPTPHVAVVPGERSRETRYWDSYWTVVGLLASGISKPPRASCETCSPSSGDTASCPTARDDTISTDRNPRVSRRGSKGVRSPAQRGAAWLAANPPPEPSEEFDDDDLDDPNRPPSLAGSEPPEVEIPMSDATRLARDALPQLVREHAYWSRPEKVVRVSVDRRDARNGVVGEYADLSRYWAYTDEPRPESWRRRRGVGRGGGRGGRSRGARASVARRGERGGERARFRFALARRIRRGRSRRWSRALETRAEAVFARHHTNHTRGPRGPERVHAQDGGGHRGVGEAGVRRR